MDTKGLRELNEEALDLADYPLFDSPYVRSAWNSGVVEIGKGDSLLKLDFNRSRRELAPVPGRR
jgi:hypothetical protein